MNTETGVFKLFLPKTGGTEMSEFISCPLGKNIATQLIPLSFMHWIGGSWPKKIFFRDRYLNLWLVKTAQVGENWYFKNGWEKFVKDNKIMRGYSLVLDYYEKDLFDIKVLGPNGRPTKGAGAFVSLDFDDETEDEEDDREEVDRALKRQEEYLSEESKDDDDDEIDQDDDRASKRQEDLSKESEGEDEETEDADYLPDQEIEVEQVKKAAVGSSKRKRKSIIPTPLYPKYSGYEVFDMGLAKQPANPHFVVQVRAKRTNDLFIPLPLVEEYKLDLPKPEMLLVDPHGREYHAKYRRWTDGRIRYTREWKFLLRRNNIVVGDTCICEFMRGEKGLYLKVSFIRTSTA